MQIVGVSFCFLVVYVITVASFISLHASSLLISLLFEVFLVGLSTCLVLSSINVFVGILFRICHICVASYERFEIFFPRALELQCFWGRAGEYTCHD